MDLIKADNGRCFWIDDTEVTVGQYDAFEQAVAKNPGALNWDPTECSWKTGLSTPDVNRNDACSKEAWPNPAVSPGADEPMRCVDWCDARAYCVWAGKDLCSAASGMSGYEPVGANDWYSACSDNKSLYPYGQQYVKGRCNYGVDDGWCWANLHDSCGASDVKTTFLSCKYDGGPVDMLGNVAEWVLPCAQTEPGRGGHCWYRGGSYKDTDPGTVSCARSDLNATRDTRRADLGFRCCAEVKASEWP